MAARMDGDNTVVMQAWKWKYPRCGEAAGITRVSAHECATNGTVHHLIYFDIGIEIGDQSENPERLNKTRVAVIFARLAANLIGL